MSLTDLIGKKIGRWTVVEESPSKSGMRYFRCRCECGHVRDVQGVALNNGRSQSCGCAQVEWAKTGERNLTATEIMRVAITSGLARWV